MMKHSVFTLLFTLALSCLSNAQKTPNILFIAVDDLNTNLGCYGDGFAISPNIDRLAKMGTVFGNNHCQQAICGPSRASIMTGLRQDTLKIWEFGQRMREINPDTITLPQFFKEKGYETTCIGKIYDFRNVNGENDPESWSIPSKTFEDYHFHPDYQKPVNGHYQSPHSKKLFEEAKSQGLKDYFSISKYMKEHDGMPAVECMEEELPDNSYTDGAIALAATELLKQLNQGGKPFFLGVGFNKPHLPFAAPKKYWNMYDRKDISIHPFQKRSSNPVLRAYHSSGELKSYSGIPKFNSYSDHTDNHLPLDQQKELIHGYYACVSFVDAQVGKLLDTLEDQGIVDNTVVVLWGDHGFHLGDHGLWHKHTNFEQATRSPLIISAPNIASKQISAAPTEFIDVFPTLCELAGLVPLPRLEGKSLVPLMKGGMTSVKPFALSQYPRGKDVMGYSIRTENYRYTEWIKGGWRTFKSYDPKLVIGRELYDYQKDPMEKFNIWQQTEKQEVLKKMQTHLHQFFAKDQTQIE
ncbi:MAG: sulfatase [Bacteroidota bacterium]